MTIINLKQNKHTGLYIVTAVNKRTNKETELGIDQQFAKNLINVFALVKDANDLFFDHYNEF
jgi:hypothetical protein